MVKRVLKWNSEVPADCIDVSVEDGLVTLAGELNWEYQREAANAAAMPLIGIRGFVDAMTVRPRATAEEVEEKIRQALHRDAEIDAEWIHVSVDEGKVTLRAVLRISADIAVAESAAWAAPEISEVESHLRSDEELASV